MPETPKTKIERLNQELAPLKEEQNRLNAEAKKWADKRDFLNEKIRDLRKKANAIKEKRNTFNKKVRKLKSLRNQLKGEYKEKRDRISELQEKIRVLEETKPKRNLRQVQRRIEEIDWKIQTSLLSMKEEQNLVSQVRQLENELVVQKQIEKMKSKLYELNEEEKKLGLEAKEIHAKLSDLAEQSQNFHLKMIEFLENAKTLQSEADEAHQKHEKARQHAQKIREKCTELLKKIKAIRKELKESLDKKKAERQNELQKQLEEKALAKLKSGEKLIWEEFQILAKKGLV